MSVTLILALTATFEGIAIVTLMTILKLCVRENVKLIRSVARSKNPEVYAQVYNTDFSEHTKHVSLAAKQNKQ